MLDGILLATDLTLASERALDLATGLSRSLRARLTVVHVYAVSPSTLAGTPPAVAERTWPGGVRARGRAPQQHGHGREHDRDDDLHCHLAGITQNIDHAQARLRQHGRDSLFQRGRSIKGGHVISPGYHRRVCGRCAWYPSTRRCWM